jgi:hypothetical protein
MHAGKKNLVYPKNKIPVLYRLFYRLGRQRQDLHFMTMFIKKRDEALPLKLLLYFARHCSSLQRMALL